MKGANFTGVIIPAVYQMSPVLLVLYKVDVYKEDVNPSLCRVTDLVPVCRSLPFPRTRSRVRPEVAGMSWGCEKEPLPRGKGGN